MEFITAFLTTFVISLGAIAAWVSIIACGVMLADAVDKTAGSWKLSIAFVILYSAFWFSLIGAICKTYIT